MDKDEFNRLTCAYLTAEGMTQEAIAAALGLGGQSAVSRYLKQARARNELRLQVVWPPDLAPAERAQVEKAVLGETDHTRLLGLLNSWRRGGDDEPAVRNLHVVYERPGETSADQAQLFGQNAAHHIATMLEQARLCGVAWGRTVRTIVDAITPPDQLRDDLTFIPVSGEPLNYHDSAISSSAAADRLATLFSNNQAPRYSLRGVPARIPKGVGDELPATVGDRQDAANQVLREFVNTSEHYKAIFGRLDQPALIDRVDMVLTSIGDIAGSINDPLYLDTKHSERVEDEYLQATTSGNLCGVWLPAQPSDPDQVAKVNAINDRWLGITRRQIEACARRSAMSGAANRPGVVVVAREPEKAAIIRQAMGMINTLVISRSLAEALLDLGDGNRG